MIFPTTLLLFYCVFWSPFFGGAQATEICDMHYNMHKNPMAGDGGFAITIRDMNGRMADRFEGGERYRITVSNSMSGIIFQDFSLYSSLEMKDEIKMMPSKVSSPRTLGHLVISRRFGSINNKCINNVHGMENKVYTGVDVTWRAPENPVACMQFQAQVIKSMSMIFENAGGLMKTICPSKMHKLSNDMKEDQMISKQSYEMPPMVKECCACGTASYKVTFKGLWSKKTHPMDWPNEKSMLHWTDLIGATHTGNYFIYYNGGQASSAVQSICSYGDNSGLKQSFASDTVKPHLKSYFSTKGLWNEDEIENSRSAIISVNRTHHLFSFLTMMGPSPDWCTGIPALDLCMQDCMWKNDLSFDLYPFDAGIKYGDTYMPKNSDRLDIPDPIKVINTTIMKDYPFTPNTPVARVMIQKVMPKYDWQCSKMPAEGVKEFDSMAMSSKESHSNENRFLKSRHQPNANSPLKDPSLAQMATFLCITSSWSLWTPCSVTCGIGSRTRTKYMMKNLKNELCRHVPLIETEACEGRKRACDFSAPCSLLSWSNWGSCNATCEKAGIQQRMRMFARANEKESCSMKMGKDFKLSEYKMCEKDKSHCDPVTICSEGLVEGMKCWKTSTRFYYDAMKHACMNFQYLGCKGSLNNFYTKAACENTCLKAVEKLPQWRREKMALLQHQSRSQSGGKKDKKMMMMGKECSAPVNYGSRNCKMSTKEQIRYYYDSKYFRCRLFFFSGCDGNSNNFASYGSCVKTCMPDKMSLMASAPKRDCVLTPWSSWGPCSSRCSYGKQWRWRHILKPPMNGGAACSRLYMVQSCMIDNC